MLSLFITNPLIPLCSRIPIPSYGQLSNTLNSSSTPIAVAERQESSRVAYKPSKTYRPAYKASLSGSTPVLLSTKEKHSIEGNKHTSCQVESEERIVVWVWILDVCSSGGRFGGRLRWVRLVWEQKWLVDQSSILDRRIGLLRAESVLVLVLLAVRSKDNDSLEESRRS
ncbi:hypothetical protein J3R30DRAFT_1678470 [Lentinula aciculospora]|uniref:Uncharacterized protein n=1 Tax=Lentinula aciculospora TaxID=153920 RepID=A0A9W8ZVJ8_9AGAR|nr:hypothetical protein J3R30DRAFT_1678470 [Lentinula aciculospora]